MLQNYIAPQEREMINRNDAAGTQPAPSDPKLRRSLGICSRILADLVPVLFLDGFVDISRWDPNYYLSKPISCQHNL